MLMARVPGEITTEEVVEDHHMEDTEGGPIHGKTQDAKVACEQVYNTRFNGNMHLLKLII